MHVCARSAREKGMVNLLAAKKLSSYLVGQELGIQQKTKEKLQSGKISTEVMRDLRCHHSVSQPHEIKSILRPANLQEDDDKQLYI